MSNQNTHAKNDKFRSVYRDSTPAGYDEWVLRILDEDRLDTAPVPAAYRECRDE